MPALFSAVVSVRNFDLVQKHKLSYPGKAIIMKHCTGTVAQW